MNRPYYTRLALLGIAVYLFIEVIILGVTLLNGPMTDLWYPLLVGGIVVGGGVAIYFWHPWGLVAGVLGGLIGITFSLDSIGTNLSYPDSFFDFAYRPVFWSAGTILLLTGSFAGLVQHFRHRTGEPGPLIVSRAALGLMGLAGVLGLTSAVLTYVGIDRVSTVDKEGATVVAAYGWEFDPKTLDAGAGRTTRLLITNKDAIVHTFTIDALGIDLKVGPWGEELLVLTSPPAGVYGFRCTIPGHEDMNGILSVQ